MVPPPGMPLPPSSEPLPRPALCTFTVRQVNGAYPVIQTPSKNVPISSRPRWGKDYADPSTFIDPLFNTLLKAGNTNYSLVGITPATAKTLGVKGNVNNVPSIAAEAKKCASTVGDVRPACYAAIDRKLTTQIVPWIPYLWRDQVNILAPNVTKWTFDQNAGLSGFGHVAVSGVSMLVPTKLVKRSSDRVTSGRRRPNPRT